MQLPGQYHGLRKYYSLSKFYGLLMALSMMVGAVGRMKIAVGSVQIPIHSVQVPVFPCLIRRVMPAAVIGPVSGVEAGVLGMERPVGTVILTVGGRSVCLLCLDRRRNCQQHKHGGRYRQKRSQR